VYDFDSYKNKTITSGNNLTVASSSSRQQPVWILNNQKIRINQNEDFVEDSSHKRRKYAPDPIKSLDDIHRIYNYFISKKQYRNLLLFTMGINLGLRCGDLLELKFGHIINKDGSIKSEIFLVEQKNRNRRVCLVNNRVVWAINLYIDYLSEVGHEINLNDYLFTSLSNNNSFKYYNTLHCKSSATTGNPLNIKKYPNAHIGVDAVEDMLKKTINEELGINVHAGTHLMRKTFAYQIITKCSDESKRTRAIEILQKILGHKSPATTLYYAGITQDEICGLCDNLYGDDDDFEYSIGLANKHTDIGRSDVN